MQFQEMEGSPDNPIILNPFRRRVPASIRNKAQFPDLNAWEVSTTTYVPYATSQRSFLKMLNTSLDEIWQQS